MLTRAQKKIILIIAILTVSLVIISNDYSRYKQQKSALNKAEKRAVVELQMISANMQSALGWIMRELLMLRDLPGLQQMLHATNSDQRQHALQSMEKEFLAMAKHHKIFQQILFIDNSGQDIIQVYNTNGETRLTPEQKLGNESGCSFFAVVIKLEKDRISCFPLDLQGNPGHLERPRSPSICFATPVIDSTGHKHGILILNVLENIFLDPFQDQQSKIRQGESFYLLNSDGTFLYHPDPKKSFGFMQQTKESFVQDEPQLASWLQTGNSGIILQKSNQTSRQTLFAFQRISAVPSIAASQKPDTSTTVQKNNTWILVKTVDLAGLPVNGYEHIRSFLPSIIFLSIIWIGLLVFLYKSSSRLIISPARKAQQSFQKRLQEEIILAEERERRHIGQVLHEELAQNLALANLKLQETERRVEQDSTATSGDATVEQLLAETRDLVGIMIDQIRTMIFDLFPTVLDDQGLVPAMLWYADHFTRQTEISISVYGVPGSLGLVESQKIYLFRSFKELLHNAWKHADTKEIVATVKKKDNHVRLTVDDDGKGFDPETIKDTPQKFRGIGLISIKQWVTAMNGTMSIESHPGKGARVVIDIPLVAGDR